MGYLAHMGYYWIIFFFFYIKILFLRTQSWLEKLFKFFELTCLSLCWPVGVKLGILSFCTLYVKYIVGDWNRGGKNKLSLPCVIKNMN